VIMKNTKMQTNDESSTSFRVPHIDSDLHKRARVFQPVLGPYDIEHIRSL